MYRVFIQLISEGFKFIERLGGRSELEKFWSELSEIFIFLKGNFTGFFKKLITEKGCRLF